MFDDANRFPPPAILGMAWGALEFFVSIWKRAKSDATIKDRHSLGIIWFVNLASIYFGVMAAIHLYQFRMPWPQTVLGLACVIFVPGLALRCWAIIHLGRFFTVKVAIARDHQLVDTGPYRYIRHPSYTGGLMAALGVSLSFVNWASLVIVFVPCCAVSLWRIHIEEQALQEGLGQPYRDYMRRTKRLIPFVY